MSGLLLSGSDEDCHEDARPRDLQLRRSEGSLQPTTFVLGSGLLTGWLPKTCLGGPPRRSRRRPSVLSRPAPLIGARRHARHPEDGRPSQDPEHFVPILETLKRTDAVINLTTGGSPHMTVAERMLADGRVQASLDCSMNFGSYPMLARYREFEHDWEARKRWRRAAIWPIFRGAARPSPISAGPDPGQDPEPGPRGHAHLVAELSDAALGDGASRTDRRHPADLLEALDAAGPEAQVCVLPEGRRPFHIWPTSGRLIVVAIEPSHPQDRHPRATRLRADVARAAGVSPATVS